MNLSYSVIAVTAGEPAGIGPDLIVQLAQTAHEFPFIVIADPTLLQTRAQQLKLPLDILMYQQGQTITPARAKQIWVLPVPLRAPCEAGKLAVENAEYVVDTLRVAAEGCLSGEFAALVTAPVQKSIINDAGISFTGHTEFFQELAQVSKVVMMLTCPGLRVALATTHLPLRAVPDAITVENLHEVLHILVNDLRNNFGISYPRILVAGLNPHAGEGGHIGREEIDHIIPALQSFSDDHCQLLGPLPADTLFTSHYLDNADAVLAMYHDQGLPVLKYKGFGQAVNITLGLPFIRTSVDHGTALSLAGTGQADSGSLWAALKQAEELAIRKHT